MKHKPTNPTSVVPVVRRRSLHWLDSLMWLAIAGTLAALLVPAKSAQTASKQTGRGTDATASTVGEPTQPTSLVPVDRQPFDKEHAPQGHEFVLQNEADFINAQNRPPAAGERPDANAPTDDSPRVTSGPTLNGPELGNPIPR